MTVFFSLWKDDDQRKMFWIIIGPQIKRDLLYYSRQGTSIIIIIIIICIIKGYSNLKSEGWGEMVSLVSKGRNEVHLRQIN